MLNCTDKISTGFRKADSHLVKITLISELETGGHGSFPLRYDIFKKIVLVLKIRNNLLFILGYFSKQEKTLSALFFLITHRFLSGDKSAPRLVENQGHFAIRITWKPEILVWLCVKLVPAWLAPERPNLDDWSCQFLDVRNSARCFTSGASVSSSIKWATCTSLAELLGRSEKIILGR